MICNTHPKITRHTKKTGLRDHTTDSNPNNTKGREDGGYEKAINNMHILNMFNLEGIYGIILLRHTILTETVLVEGMETEGIDAILTETDHLSIKPSTMI